MEAEPSFAYLTHIARHQPASLKRIAIVALLCLFGHSSAAHSDTLDKIRQSNQIVYGSDAEGGAPYAYEDRVTQKFMGFEVELMAKIGEALKVRAEFKQGPWDTLLQVLDHGDFDVVVNGYELTERRSKDYLATRPYYVYQLQLMARPNSPLHSMADLSCPKPGGGLWEIGVLGSSASDSYAQRLDPRLVRVVRFDAATTAMMKVRSGQIDGTLQDLPAAKHYIRQPEFQELILAGPPEGCGYYVMFVRKDDLTLRDALNEAIGSSLKSGDLKTILEKYAIWNDAQTVLSQWSDQDRAEVVPTRPWFDFRLLWDFFPTLLASAGTTIALSFASMPLAILAGLIIALGRLYGPRWISLPLGAYVELIRGTPLMLQLLVLFYILPEMGIRLSPWGAGILGLAINYSAYEAEIYRSGLQAIPKGQHEAALALGMSNTLKLRRIIVPQAVRIVIPTVTNDFIALFKDTSVCSILTLTELTKRYSILSNSVGGVVEFGLATALLYMAMSLPLSWLSRSMEKKLDGVNKKGA
jgi:polar amino acid transport system substrate-binding protein